MNKKINYLLAILNVVAFIAEKILILFAQAFVDSNTTVYGEPINIYGNNIVAFFMGNIVLIGLIFYLGLAIPNIIIAINNRKHKKLSFWQLIFGLIMIDYVVANIFSEKSKIIQLINDIIYIVIPIIIAIRNLVFIKKNHPSKMKIVSYILAIIVSLISIIILIMIDNIGYISQFWLVIAIIMQFVYTHSQEIDNKNKISAIILIIIQVLIVISYTLLLIYSAIITKIGDYKWNEELSYIYKNIIQLQCISDEKYLIVGNNNKFGYVNKDGEEIIKTEYDAVTPFYNIKLDDTTYYFSFARIGDEYYIISKDNKKIQIDASKMIKNCEIWMKEFLDSMYNSFTENHPGGEMMGRMDWLHFHMFVYMKGNANLSDKTEPIGEIFLKERDKKDFDEPDVYYYSNENFSMRIEPTNDYDEYTECEVTVTKSNGEKTTETLEIYELSRSSASIETYSNGGIGFRALDGVFSGWYDNYGNIIYFNTGNLKIIDVKNDKMILGEMDENGFINGKYYAFDISGQFILEAKEIVEYEENYYILTLQNKYIIVDENFNQISNEYDFVYEG